MKFLFWLVFVAVDLFVAYEMVKDEFSFGGTSPVYVSSSAGSAKTIHVLFVGDSYIYTNNLPRMLTQIASSDPGGRVVIDAQSVTKGGAHLAELLAAGDASAVIGGRHWDYVVLQEQSIWMLDESQVPKTFAAASSFAAQIRAAGVIPVIFMSWIRKPGSSWYQPPDLLVTQSPAHMQAAIDTDTTLLGTSINAPVVAVGDGWAAALQNQPEVGLYNADGSHPSAAGTYLAALMFYRYLSAHQVESVTFKPLLVSAGDAAYLRQLADTY